MKIASRFPIKESKGLLGLVIFLHLLASILSFIILDYVWQWTIIFVSLMSSLYLSLKQLKTITQASDDLCWTGEKWMIRVKNDKNKLDYQESIYLDILPSSWITREFSLLKFKVDPFDGVNTEYAWFFSHSNLGDRQYRELCYLCKQSLKEQYKENDNKLS